MVTTAQLIPIQKMVSALTVPDEIGRILWKIQSNFSGLTAEQWKNWTTIYSIIGLKQLVSDDVLECWRHFVLACRYLLKDELTINDIQIADALLLKFCTRFELLLAGIMSHPTSICTVTCKSVY